MIATFFLVLFLVCFITISLTYAGYIFYLYLIRRLRKDCLFNHGNNQKKVCQYVSFIIPTYNEEKVIKKKLINTLSLINHQNKMEIIVADDGSTDDTVSIVKSLRRNWRNRIKLVSRIEHRGKPSILNAACKAAQGEILIVSDADVFLTKKSVYHLILNFSDSTIGAVCGKETIVNPCNNIATKVEYRYRNFFHSLRAIEKTTDFPPLPFHGGLMAFRKELYRDIPHDTIGDDHEIAIRIWRSGYKVIYDPNSIFLEYATRSLSELYEQKRRRAQGVIQFIIRNKDILFNRKAGSFGNVRFPILASEFILCPFAFLIGIISLVLYSLLVSNTLWLPLVITSIVGTIVLTYSAKQQSLKDIPYMIFGLLLFQVAMVHAAIGILIGTSVEWKKIMGQRID
jgi:biofilm PGA synthesis N-glycosyltransferase PgaC